MSQHFVRLCEKGHFLSQCRCPGPREVLRTLGPCRCKPGALLWNGLGSSLPEPDSTEEVKAARATVARIREERDRLWCNALVGALNGDTVQIEKVVSLFNKIRPDREGGG